VRTVVMRTSLRKHDKMKSIYVANYFNHKHLYEICEAIYLAKRSVSKDANYVIDAYIELSIKENHITRTPRYFHIWDVNKQPFFSFSRYPNYLYALTSVISIYREGLALPVFNTKIDAVEYARPIWKRDMKDIRNRKSNETKTYNKNIKALTCLSDEIEAEMIK
jgi:hypothetical protein